MNNQQIGELIKQYGDRVIAGDPVGEILQIKGVHWGFCALKNLNLTGSPDYEYRVSLGRCEGRPVFVGDELWAIRENFSHVTKEWERGTNFDSLGWSWNPPKPKEITVTIPRDVAKQFIRYADNPYLSRTSQQVAQALKKELEKLNLTKGEINETL